MPLNAKEITGLDAAIARAREGEHVQHTSPTEDTRRECMEYLRSRGCVDQESGWSAYIGPGSIALEVNEKL